MCVCVCVCVCVCMYVCIYIYVCMYVSICVCVCMYVYFSTVNFILYVFYKQCTNKRGKVQEMTSRYFILAMGGRPRYPDIPGCKEYCITRYVCVFYLLYTIYPVYFLLSELGFFLFSYNQLPHICYPKTNESLHLVYTIKTLCYMAYLIITLIAFSEFRIVQLP